ncbi:MAG TPA: 4Fe-4S binding protein [Candidatus Omnitrophota bacterium]|nr:4Fe-4S binding protein [Candidatus Omnitrophota bacterium]
MTNFPSKRKSSGIKQWDHVYTSSVQNAPSHHWLKIFGAGALKGMVVTLKNFVTSYFRKPDQGGIFTVQYPEERYPEIENYRNLPFLVYDGSPDKVRCVACGICERECPPKCIYITMETDVAGKPVRKPAVFDIDYAVCMNCGICEEVCPFDSIFMDHVFEIASPRRIDTGMIRHQEDLLKSSEYLQKIRPKTATMIDEKKRAAEEKKKAVVKPPQGPTV